MLGGWLAIAALAVIVLVADGLTRHGRRTRTVLLVTGLAGLFLAAAGAFALTVAMTGHFRALDSIAIASGAGLAIGVLVGSAFAGLGPSE